MERWRLGTGSSTKQFLILLHNFFKEKNISFAIDEENLCSKSKNSKLHFSYCVVEKEFFLFHSIIIFISIK